MTIILFLFLVCFVSIGMNEDDNFDKETVFGDNDHEDYSTFVPGPSPVWENNDHNDDSTEDHSEFNPIPPIILIPHNRLEITCNFTSQSQCGDSEECHHNSDDCHCGQELRYAADAHIVLGPCGDKWTLDQPNLDLRFKTFI